MNTRKSIDLGNGRTLAFSHTELKNQLRRNGIDPDGDEGRRLRKHAFPSEYAAEQVAAQALVEAAAAVRLRDLNEKRFRKYFAGPEPHVARAASIPPGYRNYSHQDTVGFVKYWCSQNRPSTRHQNRVTDFSGWILEAMHGRGVSSQQDAGKSGEREVAKAKMMRLNPLPDRYSDWQLIDKDPLDRRSTRREISRLRIGDRSLVGAPDYVFHSRSADTVLIIEVKVSPAWSPPEGWANLKAQLWAYGKIDHYVGLAKNIKLVGELGSLAAEKCSIPPERGIGVCPTPRSVRRTRNCSKSIKLGWSRRPNAA